MSSSRAGETSSEVGETFKLTQATVTPRKSLNAFSDELLNCQLCHSRFKNSKSLTCLHSFCESCLEIYITKVSGENSKYFPCPVCKEISPVQRHITRATEQWLLSNEDMSSIHPATSSRLSLALDEMPTGRSDRSMALMIRNERRCDPCMENDETMTAMYWCPTCREAICDTCTKSHRGMRLTRNHALMSIDDVKEKPIRMLQSHETCPDHRGKYLDMFCQTHQCTVCSTCIAVGHRRCDTVLGVDRVARSNMSKKTTRTLAQRMRNCSSILESVLTTKEGSVKRLQATKENVLEDVARLKLSIIQLLNELEEKMKDEIDAVCRDYEDILQNKIDRTRGLKESVESSLSVMESTMESGSDYQQVMASQTLKEECDKYEALADDERIDYKEVDLAFTPDENLIRLAKMVDRMGYVEIAEKRQITKAFKNCSAQKSDTINGKIKGDRNNCIFNSVDISETGEIVLSDFNNCSVKLYDHLGQFRSSMKLNSPPRGVCILPDKQIATALPEECVIKLLSYDGKLLTHARELHTSFKAYRICNLRGKIMGICYSKACRSLSIVERNGRVEKTITRKRDYKGLGGVAFDPIKGCMYMSDRDAISCYSGSGKLMFRNTYRRTDLRGMALDCQGNIYVCSHDSGQILQISPDGVLIKSILVPVSPQDVAIEPMGNKMVVVGLGEMIHVYNLV